MDKVKIKKAIGLLNEASDLLAEENIDANDDYGTDILCSIGESINDTVNLLDRIK